MDFPTLKVKGPSHTFRAIHCDWLIKVKGMLCDCEQTNGVNIGSEVYEGQRTSKKEARASRLFLILRLSLPAR